MGWVKGILIGLVVLLAVAAAVWFFWLRGQVEYAKIGSAYAAKQTCSCLYVAERPLESCKGDFTTDTSAFAWSVDTERKSVKVSVMGGLVSNTAQFKAGLGCTLIR